MATTTKKKKTIGSKTTAGSKKAATGTRTGKKKKAATKSATTKKTTPKKVQKVALRPGPGGHYPYGNKAERERWEAEGYTVKPTASRAANLVRQGKKAGSILKKEGMAGKRARMAKGALAGTKTTRTRKTGAAKRDPNFKPTAAQKRSLPPKMIKGLVNYHKGK